MPLTEQLIEELKKPKLRDLLFMTRKRTIMMDPESHTKNISVN